MGFVKSLLSGGSGAGFKAKQLDLVQPVGVGEANAYGGLAKNALSQQQRFVNALGDQDGINNQANVFAQQQTLSDQLAQQAAGGGPNPVQAQLAQNTGQNVANQAALMAGQRGASANAGLLARQAAQQGAATQQQAVGQAATLGAQQQLNAQQALAQQQAQMQNVAANQVGNLAQGLQYANQATQGEQAQLLGAVNARDQLRVNQQNAANQANGGIAAKNAETQGSLLGGALSGAGSVVGLAHGGEVPCYSSGGPVSSVGKYFHEGSGGKKAAMPVKKMLSSHGGHVPGKANVKGDSTKNDTVPAMLSPGEVVIPRHIMKSKDAPKKAAEFVRQIMAKKGMVA